MQDQPKHFATRVAASVVTPDQDRVTLRLDIANVPADPRESLQPLQFGVELFDGSREWSLTPLQALLQDHGVEFTVTHTTNGLSAQWTARRMQVSNDPPPELPLSGARVLVIEDEAPLRMVFTEILQHLSGATVLACADGASGLDACAAAVFDVIVLDVRMSPMDGREVFARLPADERAKVVFVTGDIEHPHTREFMQACGRPVLPKPVGVDDLVAVVRSIRGGP